MRLCLDCGMDALWASREPGLVRLFGWPVKMNSNKDREPRPLVVSGRVAKLLARLRKQAGVSGRVELDLDKVHEVESAFAVHFGDDVLAMFAADTPPLSDQYAIRITKVVGHTGAMLSCRGARGDLVAIGKNDRDYVCVEKLDRSPSLVVFVPDRQSFSTVLIGDWLAQHVDDSAIDQGSSQFFPSLYKVPPMSSTGQRVRHNKFGEGLLLCEIGTGPTRKVKVDFPGVGLKVIQARFLDGLDS